MLLVLFGGVFVWVCLPWRFDVLVVMGWCLYDSGRAVGLGICVVCGCCDCVGLSCFGFDVAVNSVVMTFICVCNLPLVVGL